mgnify:CR=1 FL=1
MRKNKVDIITLGCSKNLVDSEQLMRQFVANGYTVEHDPHKINGEIVVVNTCGFIGDAQEESINMILDLGEAKKKGKIGKLFVMGCLSERFLKDLENELPEVDRFYGKFNWKELLNDLGKSYYRELAADRVLTTPRHYAYLKIAEGCDKRCTYCIIPYIRGNYRSVPMEELVAQAKELVAAGAKELILVAQETTLYGVDLYGEKSLHKLLDALNEIPGLFWIRIMYCYPEEIYEELIDAIARNEKVCHYLDLPIQHANDTMLKRMGRRTSNADLVRIITHLRERIPDITLRTTLICGFPGETKEMHEELMQFINDMEFDRLGAFTYSPEEGTPAAEFPDQIDEETKKEWQADVMELQEEIIFDKNEEMKGRELYVFIEGKVSDENAYIGRTYRDAPDVDGYIFINTDEELMTGDIVRARVTGAYEYDLIGELL